MGAVTKPHNLSKFTNSKPNSAAKNTEMKSKVSALKNFFSKFNLITQVYKYVFMVIVYHTQHASKYQKRNDRKFHAREIEKFDIKYITLNFKYFKNY